MRVTDPYSEKTSVFPFYPLFIKIDSIAMYKVWEIIKKYPLILYLMDFSYGGNKTFKSTKAYDLLKEMENYIYPTREDDYVRCYYYLFLPVNVKGKIKFVPTSFCYLKEFDEYEFFVHTKGGIRIGKGDEKLPQCYNSLLIRVYIFMKMQYEDPIFITTKDIYKHYLVGEVKLKYVIKPKMSKDDAKQLLIQYKENLKNKLQSDDITLRDYLEVVKIVYEANKLEMDNDLKELYKRYADGRDCGMMDLPLDDKEAFKKWLHGEAHCGGHPFEIIRGGFITYGVYLYPPRNGRYTIIANDFIDEYINAVKEFLKRKIPFRAPDLINVLKYLTGELVVKVNDYSDFPRHLFIFYSEVENKKKIKWEEVEEVNYRRKRHN
ncbi:hypothetical protein [Sulfurisphaera ohwakuensis]|uniref:Uncharacterized protein n=2 Tax=Sulfurisphaera ohwakuensis TaxID=69656 RepID=A0A7J9RW90_SULOH|nr:hypothetical protein [Sulfurisphaera ohwakuensis]MBB5255253.1 hypothetical protein [Sulfurisphaera ohwakuensis]